MGTPRAVSCLSTENTGMPTSSLPVMSSGFPRPAVSSSGSTLLRVSSGGTILIPVSGEHLGQWLSVSMAFHRDDRECRVMVVAPFLFQVTFN